jgi:hypothetical protein
MRVLAGLVIGAVMAMVGCQKEKAPVAASPTLFATPAPKMTPGEERSQPRIPAALALKQTVQLNPYAFVPPQCFTKTTDETGQVHNPCYTCHVESRAPNYVNDGDVQLAYGFVPGARSIPWKNLFVDWTERIRGVSDEQITSYVRTSNYFDGDGRITLQRRLEKPPEAWDLENDGRWAGFVPDARFSFDERGYDRTPDRGYTGWRAFAYYPVPGTFFPTNGSMGDVLIRLPAAFRETEDGSFDLALYELNLAVLEALIARRDVEIAATAEAPLQVDLDRDGKLGTARRVTFVESSDTAPTLTFLGRARLAQQAGQVHAATGLYPEGTEFLHTVRYLDPTAEGVRMAARLKELRYARKVEWWSYARLAKRALAEAEEKTDSPAEQRAIGGNIELGANNGAGWQLQGFIEDASGDLRPQTFEESAYCTGCHGGVGVTDDSMFSFSRRLGPRAFQRGWYHWTQRGLEGLGDRARGSQGEYVTYLRQNGASDEFRQNAEVRARFFDANARLRGDKLAVLRSDVSSLLVPSSERALSLNKAYFLLVREQSFRYGRDLVLDGAKNVHRRVDPDQATGVTEPLPPAWKIASAGDH